MRIETLTIIGGTDKSGHREISLTNIHKGETCCIVGPTGAGKSRLLADIEWLAQGDTPSGRQILLNHATPDPSFHDGLQGKLVAQLTQNMNFVLDMSVIDFLVIHTQSLNISDEHAIDDVITSANRLCGEAFHPTTPLTSLSGGQSRALMIADVACLGKCPIVVIDEIENAGIDKLAALQLLTDREKIVFLASHDPLLILQSDLRIIIHNGGIANIARSSRNESACVLELRAMEQRQKELREKLRYGLAVA